jgi:hypothetical protein
MVITPPQSIKHVHCADTPEMSVEHERPSPGPRTFVRHSVRHRLPAHGETETRHAYDET